MDSISHPLEWLEPKVRLWRAESFDTLAVKCPFPRKVNKEPLCEQLSVPQGHTQKKGKPTSMQKCLHVHSSATVLYANVPRLTDMKKTWLWGASHTLTLWPHLYEMSRVGKLEKADDRLVARGEMDDGGPLLRNPGALQRGWGRGRVKRCSGISGNPSVTLWWC